MPKPVGMSFPKGSEISPYLVLMERAGLADSVDAAVVVLMAPADLADGVAQVALAVDSGVSTSLPRVFPMR